MGLGTSLPELVTSIAAIRRGAGKLAIGNILGRNTFDLLLTLGIGSAISGFLVSKDLHKFDIPVLFVVSLVAVILLATGKRLRRKEAFVLIRIYAVYFLIKLVGALSGAG